MGAVVGAVMPRAPKYRFEVGTTVLCRTGQQEWKAGEIVALNYREDDWPAGAKVPYQVQLDEGALIFVPKDVDMLCRELVPPWWRGAFDGLEERISSDPECNPSAEFLVEAAGDYVVSETDHNGNTALMEAVKLSWPNGVSQLISMEVNVNASGPNKTSALHIAAAKEDPEIVKLLVAAKADVNRQDADPDYDPEFTSTTFGDRLEHRSPLHYACLEGNVAAARLLIIADADVNIQDAQWNTPLHLAIEADQDDCIDLLLSSGADVNLCNQASGMLNSTLMDAASAGNTPIVQKLIQAKADIHKSGKQDMSALHLASRNRHTKVVEILLAAKADMNQESKLGTALQLARKNGGPDLLKMFGDEAGEADGPSKVGMSPPLTAAQKAALFVY